MCHFVTVIFVKAERKVLGFRFSASLFFLPLVSLQCRSLTEISSFRILRLFLATVSNERPFFLHQQTEAVRHGGGRNSTGKDKAIAPAAIWKIDLETATVGPLLFIFCNDISYSCTLVNYLYLAMCNTYNPTDTVFERHRKEVSSAAEIT